MYNISNTEVFKKLIGNKIQTLRSSYLHVHSGSITMYELDLIITCKRFNLHINGDRTEFIENEEGNVFYNYLIYEDTERSFFQKSSVEFNTSEIIQMDIYGRNFNDEEFIKYPDIYKEIKGIKKTDDAFLFTCREQEKIMVVFHPFLPQMEVYYKQAEREMFWNQYGEDYQLHHSIK